MDVFQILQDPSYKVWSETFLKILASGLLNLVQGMAAIRLQPACCYAVTTSKIRLYTNLY